MSVITRADLAEYIVNSCGADTKEAKKTVNVFFDAITTLTMQGERVRVPRLGTFQQQHKKPRMGRNPKTLEPSVIPARTIVKCSFVNTFTEAVLDASKSKQ